MSHHHPDSAGPNLWVLFMVLFLLLLLISLFVVCHAARNWCARYCLCRKNRCGCFCCAIDMEAYRSERESLRRLRELRRLHRLHELQARRELEHHMFSTFSQIPGPIPHSFASTGRVATPADARHTPAFTTFGSLGFVLVPAGAAMPRHLPLDVTSLHMRHELTAEQRRSILERLLVFKAYHCAKIESAPDLEEGSDTETAQAGNVSPQQDGLDQKVPTNGSDQQEEEESSSQAQSYAFPLHEEPETPDQTCAICLDDFVEGEQINAASKCQHVFHKTCLLEWLDQHDICPCCRRTMITDSEWRHAASETLHGAQMHAFHPHLVAPANVPESPHRHTSTAVHQNAI